MHKYSTVLWYIDFDAEHNPRWSQNNNKKKLSRSRYLKTLALQHSDLHIIILNFLCRTHRYHVPVFFLILINELVVSLSQVRLLNKKNIWTYHNYHVWTGYEQNISVFYGLLDPNPNGTGIHYSDWRMNPDPFKTNTDSKQCL